MSTGVAEQCQRVAIVPVRDAPKVADGVRWVHGEIGIVRPVLRIADADVQRLQLSNDLRFGGRRHPRRGLDAW